MVVKIFGREVNLNRTTVAALVAAVLVLFFIINYFLGDKVNEKSVDTSVQVKIGTIPRAINTPRPKTQKTIKVYICGEVVRPGVYTLPQGIIVNYAIKMAGGTTKNAWKEFNLAWQIDQNVMLRVPNKRAPFAYPVVTTGIDFNSSPIDLTGSSDGNKSVGNLNGKKIDLNTANVTQLMELPGVGPSTAKKIIEYRKTSKFKVIEDIKNVTGIGDKKFEDLKKFIVVK